MEAPPPDALIPFCSTTGPKTARIALVGEAWGKNEAQIGLPFVGWSGQELTRMMADAGLSRGHCFLTNVFPFQPSGSNDLTAICGPKAAVGADYPLPGLKSGQYVLRPFLPCLDRLRAELQEVRPNLIVALGGTASWALTGQAGITKVRGVICESTLVPGIKVLPTFHPASVLRNWAQRPITVADFLKAKIEAEFPEIRRISRQLLVHPNIEELYAWWKSVHPSDMLAADIETKAGQITMISFANSAHLGVVVPFVRPKAKWLTEGVSYWPSLEAELLAWDFVGKVLNSSNPKLFQNGLYDMQYLARMGFYIRNASDDTMLLHHSLYPELPKSLGFLGSIYCNESAWKQLRTAKEVEKPNA